MKKIIIAIIFALLICSCSIENTFSGDKRFVVVLKQEISIGEVVIVFKDRETNIEYVYFSSGIGGGLTKLEKRESE